MGLFKKDSQQETLTERQVLENKYASACGNIMLVVAFTVINIVLLLIKADSYFLFSAYVPYAIASLGALLCGMAPAEAYTGDMAMTEFLPISFFAVCLVVAVVIIALYLICWLLARKQKTSWITVALVLFGIDTLLMLVLAGFDTTMIMDYVFHAWVVISLIGGISAAKKLKNLPEEPKAVETEISPETVEETPAAIEETEKV